MSPREIAKALSKWFAVAQREMSWRKTRDPYAVWVSEVMLQQTRVDTVEGYYPKFLARFPTVDALAAADEDDVLSAWSGLGYYRRARLLHRGAKYVSEALAGELPSDTPALRKIPGVGPYTAGAIASIAFDKPEPLVDGNVARVLSRFHAIEDPVAQDAKAKRHWEEVAQLVTHGSPRVLTQALMELGATVCTPKRPRCDACPLAKRCRARALGRAGDIMVVRKKANVLTQRYWALMLTCGGKTLMWRRPTEGLLAGMWCAPLLDRTARSKPPSAEAVAEFIGAAVDLDDVSHRAVKHVFTHRIWQLVPCSGRLRRAPRKLGDTAALVETDAMPAGGVPAVTKKLLRAVES